jgi:peptide/nickel transport system permease protein
LTANRYLRAASRRLLQLLPTIAAVVVVAFALMAMAPGDLVDVMAAEGQLGDRAQLDRLRALYGLDVPLAWQFINYAIGVLRLDLGFSFRHNLPVLTLILERMPATLLLMSAALGFAVAAGVALGVLAAMRFNTVTDRAISALAVVFFATPNFWLSLMLVVAFSIHLGWLPVAGMETIGGVAPSALARAGDIARHLVLPALSLGLLYAAVYARMTRSAMVGLLGEDFVRTARAKGVAERRIVWKHVLRNALLPVVTLISLHVATLFAGAVVVESVFSWPGLGSLLMEAVGARNYPVVMGVLIFSAIVVALSNLVVDLLYMALDPRVELR